MERDRSVVLAGLEIGGETLGKPAGAAFVGRAEAPSATASPTIRSQFGAHAGACALTVASLNCRKSCRAAADRAAIRRDNRRCRSTAARERTDGSSRWRFRIEGDPQLRYGTGRIRPGPIPDQGRNVILILKARHPRRRGCGSSLILDTRPTGPVQKPAASLRSAGCGRARDENGLAGRERPVTRAEDGVTRRRGTVGQMSRAISASSFETGENGRQIVSSFGMMSGTFDLPISQPGRGRPRSVWSDIGMFPQRNKAKPNSPFPGAEAAVGAHLSPLLQWGNEELRKCRCPCRLGYRPRRKIDHRHSGRRISVSECRCRPFFAQNSSKELLYQSDCAR